MTALPLNFNELNFSGTAASGGGTYVKDIDCTPFLDKAMHVEALIFMSALSAGHLSAVAHLGSSCVVANKNGAVSFTPALPASSNPDPSGGAASPSQPNVSDAGFGTPTATFTIVGSLLRLTVTNLGATNADVMVDFTITTFGSK